MSYLLTMYHSNTRSFPAGLTSGSEWIRDIARSGASSRKFWALTRRNLDARAGSKVGRKCQRMQESLEQNCTDMQGPQIVKTRQDTKRFPAAGQSELRGPVTAHAFMKIRLRFGEQASVTIINTYDQKRKLTSSESMEPHGRRVVSLATVLGSQNNCALKLRAIILTFPRTRNLG